MENENKEVEKKSVKWEQIRREQFGFFTNLLITVSLGFLSFLLNSGNQRFIDKSALTISIICLILSIIFGLWLSYNRLYDFRLTVKKIKGQEFKGKVITSEVLEKIGNQSWLLLKIQLILFGMSLFVLIFAIGRHIF